jgi:site-specific recombinase XerD
MLAGHGLSLSVIGALLGHTHASTTQRYAHLADDPLRAATAKVNWSLMRASVLHPIRSHDL